MDIDNAPPLSTTGISSDVTFMDETSQKRRKVTHITSAPLPTTHQEVPAGPLAGPSSTNNWNHLLRWQQLYGEEEINLAELDGFEDEEPDSPEDAVEEDPHDTPDDDEHQEEQVQGRSKLTHDQIVDIINERIEQYTNSWTPNKGVEKADEVKYDLEKMWDEAEATGQRQRLVAQYEVDRAYYGQRLDQLCNEILKFPASNAEKVRRQCKNLEVTVNSMELAKWLLSIYQLEPVSDSEEELDDSNVSAQHDRTRPSPTQANHQAKAVVEIIDLGSPSEISGEEDAVILDSSTELALNVHEDRPTSPRRAHTPDSVITDTVELPINVRPGPPVTNGPSLSSSKMSHGDEPENASITTVRRWRWIDLIDTQDRKRIVSKAVSEMKTEDREVIRTRLGHVGKANMIKEIPACIMMLSKRESKMQGVLPRDLMKIVTVTRLFLSWWLCDNYFQEEPYEWQLDELQQCLEEGSPDPSTFCDYLNTIMLTTFSKEALRHPERPSQAEVIEISDDDDEPARGPALQRKNPANKPQGSGQSSAIVLD